MTYKRDQALTTQVPAKRAGVFVTSHPGQSAGVARTVPAWKERHQVLHSLIAERADVRNLRVTPVVTASLLICSLADFSLDTVTLVTARFAVVVVTASLLICRLPDFSFADFSLADFSLDTVRLVTAGFAVVAATASLFIFSLAVCSLDTARFSVITVVHVSFNGIGTAKFTEM